MTKQSADMVNTRGSLKKVIITGDDFGLALPVNEAIAEAHAHGILTAASLMVGAEHARDAVERARHNPSLRVGLHLTLVEGAPVLPPKQIPDLVDGSGAFGAHLVRAGFEFFFRPGIRRQLEAEIRAQFEAFRQTGLALDHVSAHNHMHMHPTVLGLILKVGKDFGLKAVRLPNEPPLRSWKAARASLRSRVMSYAFLYPWIKLMKRRLIGAGIKHNDFMFGMADCGNMTLDFALRLVRHLPEGITEVCFHPATGRCRELDRTMPGYRHEDEFKALTSKTMRDALDSIRLKAIAFSDI